MSPVLPFGAAIAIPRPTALGGLIEPGRLHEAIPARPGAEPAALGFLAGLTGRWTEKSLLWVREQTAAAETGELYAPGLASLGLDLRTLLLVNTRKRAEAFWAAEQGLKLERMIVLIELGTREKPADLTATRRLSLACEKSGATALMMRADLIGAPTTPSSAWTRWGVEAAPSASAVFDEVGAPTLSAILLRYRAGPAGARFTLDWKDHALVASAETLGGDLAASAFDRPDRKRIAHA
jgi:protein ImuA